ncbi:nuclear transport factor 2 family protein [Caballeronia sordidicola]|uniref:nuclear transport factor 2 family protein n=1 Tax=Caballeronia sordidicola TaxID=196367 RepID=UPI0004D01C39|nr:nuclear transport factor 2 family protein [Caballeronia sordidicola]
MTAFSRRKFIGSLAATMPLALTAGRAFGFSDQGIVGTQSAISAEIAQEKTWAFFRAFYQDWNSGNPSPVLARLTQSSAVSFSDATINIFFQGINTFAPVLDQLFSSELHVLGTANVVTPFRVTGDINFGAIVEQVTVRNAFFSTNGGTEQRVFDFDNGLVVRMTDYWDSRELGESDIVGPAVTQGVAFPFAPVHPGGTPLSSSSLAAPGKLALTTSATGQPSASSEMIEFAKRFHSALSSGDFNAIQAFFTDDAIYVNPLLHQGPVLYGNYNQTIQIQGLELISKLFFTLQGELPDCFGSTLLHIVGGRTGGGFEWKAGGPYSNTGVNRNGLNGSTAIELYNGKIRWMSVKFDTYQLQPSSYNFIRSKLLAAGIVDQDEQRLQQG